MVKVSLIRYIVLLIILSMTFMFYLNLRMHSTGNLFLQKIFISFNKKDLNLQESQQGMTKLVDNLPNIFVRKAPEGIIGESGAISKHSQQTIKISTKVQRKIHPFVPVTMFRSMWEKVPYRSNKQVDMFKSWEEDRDVVCDGRISFYNKNFLYTTSMVINKDKAKSVNLGGEEINAVILQDEIKEYYEYELGFFYTKCPNKPSYEFENKNHLTDWLFSIKTKEYEPQAPPQYRVDDFTIAIMRYEYVNLYHTMTDWYNAFLVKEFFNKTSAETNILIVDTHPQGALDPVWSHLFNYTRRLSKLPTITNFTNLAWGILSYNTPMHITWSNYQLPLIEEFRSFFLSAFNIQDHTNFDCSQLKILFIWRRDYLAHPRNPNGTISRKISNEAELLRYLRETLPADKFNIKASQIDQFSMTNQLEMVVWADIMIGMHGAGLTHAVFLRKSSALIELQPNYYKGDHFFAIAKWRKLVYTCWENTDPLKELPNKSTIIPPAILLTLIKKTSKAMCSQAQYKRLFGLDPY